MTELTSNRHIIERYPALTKKEKWPIDTSAAFHIYKGGPVMLDMNVDTTHIKPFIASVTAASTDVTVGVAMEEAEVVLSAPETTEIVVLIHGEIGIKSTAFTDADVGKVVYWTSSDTLSVTEGTGIYAGRIARVADGYVYYLINPGGFVPKS